MFPHKFLPAADQIGATAMWGGVVAFGALWMIQARDPSSIHYNLPADEISVLPCMQPWDWLKNQIGAPKE